MIMAMPLVWMPSGTSKSNNLQRSSRREPVWPSGNALDWKAEGLRFDSASATLSGHSLVTSSLTVKETLKLLPSLLIQESLCW